MNKKENEELFKNISEDKKSEFVFKGEHLYYLGQGHAFLRGFLANMLPNQASKLGSLVDYG